jgi:hypothetical protein
MQRDQSPCACVHPALAESWGSSIRWLLPEFQHQAARQSLSNQELLTPVNKGLEAFFVPDLEPHGFSNLGNSESVIYSLSAGLRWTPFDFGAIRSRVKASEF